jgi:geranylgeranyl diphosphate synthase type II
MSVTLATNNDQLSLARSRLRECIDAALPRYVEFDAGCPPELADAIRYALLGAGKRLRPQLVLMAAQACGGSVEAAMPAACAIEMVHAYSLVHDDLPAMDDDDLRRGRPTCHKVFGEAVAILAGDALLARAFELLASGIQPPAIAARCCEVLGRAAGACALVGGQVADLQPATIGHATPHDISELESIHRRKTGALFIAALELGGIIARAEPEQLAALAAYGRNLGLAFQITDDLLDVDCSQANLGKRVAKHAGRGTLTYPKLLGIDESRRRAGTLVDEACTMIEVLGPQAAPLCALARFVSSREN